MGYTQLANEKNRTDGQSGRLGTTFERGSNVPQPTGFNQAISAFKHLDYWTILALALHIGCAVVLGVK